MRRNVNASAEFFKAVGIEGPVFNDYNIGNYLIFHLFPKERVFIDNRPEAYPTDFLKDVYNTMLTREDVWRRYEALYHLNVIYFDRRDHGPGVQEFLWRRVLDPEWIEVYVDDFAIIFLKDNEKNQKIIRRFQLPPAMFNMRYRRMS